MSSPVDTITAVLAGRPGAAEALLAPCPVSAYGAEVFGPKMAGEVFRRQPSPLSQAPHIVAGDQCLAIFDTDESGQAQAVFADLYQGHIGRLWRLGAGEPGPEAERGLVVAVDPMMSQLRNPTALTRSDHPGLDEATADAIRQLAAAIAEAGPDDAPWAEARVAVIRVVIQDGRGAALLVVDHMPPGEHRRRRQSYAAVAFRMAGGSAVHSWTVFDRVAAPSPRVTLVPVADDSLQGSA